MSGIMEIFRDLFNSLKDMFWSETNLLGETAGEGKFGKYNLQDDYLQFPRYEGTSIIGKPIYTSNYQIPYKRATMLFQYDADQEEMYKQQLLNEGFIQGSTVRYDKNIEGRDTYVIVERENNYLKIAFHIKLDK